VSPFAGQRTPPLLGAMRACAGCSFLADQVAHPAHLDARDTTLMFVSRAPQAFDADFGVDQMHGTNAFVRDGDRIFRTHFVSDRGDEQTGNTWNNLDITTLGRQDEWEDSPPGYPQTPPYTWCHTALARPNAGSIATDAYAAAMLSRSDADRVAVRFGLGRDAVISGPVARGELGQVWCIDTSRGRWAVKEPFEAPSQADAADDVRYQEVVRETGVPMPAPVRTVDGDVVADVGSAVVRVYEWVDLEPVDRRVDPAAVGQLVASIHRVEHYGHSPVHWWYTDPVGAVRWNELVTELAAVGAPFAPQLAAQRDELVALEALLEAPANLQTCHRDLFADNILRTAAGGLCVIDWENSGLADPTQELAVVLIEFACGDAARARQLYSAYIDGGGPGRLERPGQFSMAIAQLGHLGERACRLWLDPTQDPARSTARVEEFLGEPITRQFVHRLLDAIAP
jgi:Ser/Thr protein kinase RdoA (MazF antagonist)